MGETEEEETAVEVGEAANDWFQLSAIYSESEASMMERRTIDLLALLRNSSIYC